MVLQGGDFSSHMDGYTNESTNASHHRHGDTSSILPLIQQDIHHNRKRSFFHDDSLKRLVLLVTTSERVRLLASTVLLIVTSGVQLSTPYLAGRIIDSALDETSQESVAQLLFFFFCVMALAACLTYLRTTMQVRVGHELTCRMRKQTFAAMLSQDAAYFDAHKLGDLLSRLASDAELLQSAVTNSIPSFARNLIMSAGSAMLLLYTCWSLALVALAILPPTMILARLVGRRIKQRHSHVQQKHGEATSLAEQALTCIRTVQQFCAEGYELHQYSHAVTMAHQEAIQTAKLQASFSSAVQISANGSMLCVLAYGASLIRNGTLTAGALAGFVMVRCLLACLLVCGCACVRPCVRASSMLQSISCSQAYFSFIPFYHLSLSLSLY